jgi:predicted dehydrogenase
MTQLNALLIGAGGMGKSWAKNLTTNGDVNLAGWVDIRPQAAEQAAHELGITTGYYGVSLDEAIAQVRPDFVVDVTIPEAHHDVTLTCLNAGIPVIGEKPMAISMEQARAMVATAERTGVRYMVSQSRRYDARLWAYRELISNIGDVGILDADFYIGAHFGGFRDEMAHVLLLDMAIHTFDAARYLLGDTYPVSVYCEEFNPAWSWYRGNAGATAIFTMANGTRFTYRGCWAAEGLHTSWESEWRAVGAKGTAKWDGHATIEADVVVDNRGFHAKCHHLTAQAAPDIAHGIAGSLQDFVHSLRTGATPMGDCRDNIHSLAMVFGAIESAKSGQKVWL